MKLIINNSTDKKALKNRLNFIKQNLLINKYIKVPCTSAYDEENLLQTVTAIEKDILQIQEDLKHTSHHEYFKTRWNFIEKNNKKHNWSNQIESDIFQKYGVIAYLEPIFDNEQDETINLIIQFLDKMEKAGLSNKLKGFRIEMSDISDNFLKELGVDVSYNLAFNTLFVPKALNINDCINSNKQNTGYVKEIYDILINADTAKEATKNLNEFLNNNKEFKECILESKKLKRKVRRNFSKKKDDLLLGNTLKEYFELRNKEIKNLILMNKKVKSGSNLSTDDKNTLIIEQNRYLKNTNIENALEILLHEMGHSLHIKSGLINFLITHPISIPEISLFNLQFHPEIKEKLLKEISFYAASSPADFVAEIFVKLINNEKINSELLELYQLLGGYTPLNLELSK